MIAERHLQKKVVLSILSVNLASLCLGVPHTEFEVCDDLPIELNLYACNFFRCCKDSIRQCHSPSPLKQKSDIVPTSKAPQYSGSNIRLSDRCSSHLSAAAGETAVGIELYLNPAQGSIYRRRRRQRHAGWSLCLFFCLFLVSPLARGSLNGWMPEKVIIEYSSKTCWTPRWSRKSKLLFNLKWTAEVASGWSPQTRGRLLFLIFYYFFFTWILVHFELIWTK